MKKILLYVFFLVSIGLNLQHAYIQILNCKLNISSNGKHLQIGNVGGSNAPWVMKGARSAITHLTPDSTDPTGWEVRKIVIK